MKIDLVSIIIPVYNVEPYVAQCIESVLQQTYTNLQIIIINDGSTDHSLEICKRYQDQDHRILLIDQSNHGLSETRNIGLQYADGEYVYFLDSDDYIESNLIELCVQTSKTHQAQVVYFDALCELELGVQTHFTTHTLMKKQFYGTGNGVSHLRQLHHHEEYISAVQFYFYRLEYLKKHHFEFCQGILHEDELFTLQVMINADVVCHLPLPLYHYRIRANSIMNSDNTIRRFQSLVKIIHKLLKFKQKFHENANERVMNNYLARLFVMSLATYGLLNPSQRKQVTSDKNGLYLAVKENNFLHSKQVRLLIYLGQHTDLYYKNRHYYKLLKRMVQRAKYIVRVWIPFQLHPEDKYIMLATPIHGNLGDQAIILGQKQFLKQHMVEKRKYSKTILEVRNDDWLNHTDRITKLITSRDTIIIGGGGSIGTQWPDEDDKITDIIQRFSKQPTIIFPQTCWYQGDVLHTRLNRNRSIYEQAKHLTIMCRDIASYHFMKEHFPKNHVMLRRDIVMSLDLLRLHRFADCIHSKREGIVLCFRRDHEKVLEDRYTEELKTYISELGLSYTEQDTVVPQMISIQHREVELHNIWNVFGSSKLVITDRLHGMIFAAITHTPCIALNNNSGKVKGSYQFLRENPNIWFVEDATEVFRLLPELVDTK